LTNITKEKLLIKEEPLRIEKNKKLIDKNEFKVLFQIQTFLLFELLFHHIDYY
jgi:hypothetical protein